MFRSLAVVGITGTIMVATAAVQAQQAATPPTTNTVLTNHMPNEERDRVMEEAMAKARKELEASQAEKRKQEAERKKAAEAEARKKAEEAAAKKKAEEIAKQEADRKKAEEKRLAEELAAKEKERDEKKQAEAKPATKTEDVKDLDKVKSESRETAKKSGDAPAKKDESSAAKKDEEPAEEKSVVKSVPTAAPGSNITVKTTMPEGDAARRAEQAAAARADREGRSGNSESQSARSAAPARTGSSASSGGSSDEVRIEGYVVGIVRGPSPHPRILVDAGAGGPLVPVQLSGDQSVPAPQSFVNVRGRHMTDPADGRVVVSARSISVKDNPGPTMAAPPAPDEPPFAGDPFLPPGAPVGMMPPPMPGPMMPPGPFVPPPF